MPQNLKKDEHYVPKDQYGRTILTVRELREKLAYVDGDLQVVMDDGDEWYVNVGEVIVPCRDRDRAEFACVTLMRGEGFDSRQF